MGRRNSKVILSKNIKMDSEYRNVYNVSESNMISLMSDNSHLVYSASNYSYLREEENTIYLSATYSTCLQANYLAFQNPDYSNKWFFAFIDQAEYVNDSTTRIRYKLDVFTTWNDYFSYKSCFVVREHVTDDTLGAHTVPEGLETGDYIVNSHLSDSYNNDTMIAMSVTELVDGTDTRCAVYNGLPSYACYLGFESLSSFESIVRGYTHPEAILDVFVTPKWLIPDSSSHHYAGSPIQTSSTVATQELGITRISSLDGYTPNNKKCLTYPYCYILGTNGAGSTAIYQQELWSLNNSNEMVFRMYGTLCVGCSIKGVPINYNGDGVGVDYGINLAKFPTLNKPGDTFTNWLTQNSVNQTATALTSVGSLGIGVATGNPVLMYGGAMGIVGQVTELYQRSKVPPQIDGNVNAGDVGYSSGFSRFNFYRMTVKQEYARIIDNYFKLRGYKVNTVKVPNTSHRQNFNYIQIAEDDSTAYANNHNNIQVPPRDLDEINSLFRRGITIWNNHTNLGDMSVSNNITS